MEQNGPSAAFGYSLTANREKIAVSREGYRKMARAIPNKELIRQGESGKFDFAFIDADKEGYELYYELCLQLVRSGGIIALDNMLWGGSVYNPRTDDPDAIVLRSLATKLHSDTRVHVSFLTVGDGTLLAFKR